MCLKYVRCKCSRKLYAPQVASFTAKKIKKYNSVGFNYLFLIRLVVVHVNMVTLFSFFFELMKQPSLQYLVFGYSKLVRRGTGISCPGSRIFALMLLRSRPQSPAVPRHIVAYGRPGQAGGERARPRTGGEQAAFIQRSARA
jgi:hypothetical protein